MADEESAADIAGRVALERVAESIPSLILLDLMMPKVDGFAFVDALRANAPWQKIPVVVITALDLSEEDRQRLSGRVDRIMHEGTLATDLLAKEIRRSVTSLVGHHDLAASRVEAEPT